jgi:lysophospholipase L1-like esterase
MKNDPQSFHGRRSAIAQAGAAVGCIAGCVAWIVSCANPVEHAQKPVLTTITTDTTIAANDNVCLQAHATRGREPAAEYRWSIDGGITADTAGGTWCRSWLPSDAAEQQVLVWALFADGEVAGPETIRVTIDGCKPLIALPADTIVAAGESLRVTATVRSACAGIAGYRWSFDGGVTFADTTRSLANAHAWSVADTGMRGIALWVTDAAGNRSPADVMRVRVIDCFADLRLPPDTALVVGDTLTITAAMIAHRNPIAFYVWSSRSAPADTTHVPRIVKIWGPGESGVDTVIAKACDMAGHYSRPDTMVVTVGSCAPEVRLVADTVAFAGDTVRMSATIVNACRGVAFFAWSCDSGKTYADTTYPPRFTKAISMRDTGTMAIAVRIVDRAGEVSAPARAVLRVGLDPPAIAIMDDTTISVNDTVMLHAAARPGARPLDHFLWSVDGGPFDLITGDALLPRSWPVGAAGTHRVKVVAVDIRGVASAADSMIVTVLLNPPRVKAPHDTTISARDSLVAVFSASDTNGPIAAYLWSAGGPGWTDSTAEPRRTIRYGGVSPLTVFVGARDDDGLVAADSFRVTFNHPPAFVAMTQPAETAWVRLADSSWAKGRVRFSFSALDSDGISDTIAYRLYLGKRLDSLALAYEGHDPAASIEGLDTARYYWMLIAQDLFGDTAASAGSFMCVRQRTICFAGHSIVWGFDGDGVSGGFRKTVLKSMRAALPGALQSVGPLLTGQLDPPADDSTLAVGGSTAPQLQSVLVYGAPELTADFWVIMLGVNGGYQATEKTNTILIIEEVHRRNPEAGIYVVGGLPYPFPAGAYDRYYWGRIYRKEFDSLLIDTVAAKTAQGWDIRFVDVYNAFMSSDTTRNDSLFTDDIHPNQRGYGVMATAILDAMGMPVVH